MPGAMYEKELKARPEWKYLYNKWLALRKHPHSEEFDLFEGFYDWSMTHGFVLSESRLEILDASKPCSPDNCRWRTYAIGQAGEYTEAQKRQIVSWNKAVNRLRIHFGMEPFPEGGGS